MCGFNRKTFVNVKVLLLAIPAPTINVDEPQCVSFTTLSLTFCILWMWAVKGKSELSVLFIYTIFAHPHTHPLRLLKGATKLDYTLDDSNHNHNTFSVILLLSLSVFNNKNKAEFKELLTWLTYLLVEHYTERKISCLNAWSGAIT